MDTEMEALVIDTEKHSAVIVVSDDDDNSPISSITFDCVMADGDDGDDSVAEPVLAVPSPKLHVSSMAGDGDAAAGPPPLPNFSDLELESEVEDDGRLQHEAASESPDDLTTPHSCHSPVSPSIRDTEVEGSSDSDVMGTTLELDPSPYHRRLRDVGEDPLALGPGSSSASPFPRFAMTLMGKFHSIRVGGVVDEITRTEAVSSEVGRLPEAGA